MSATKDFIPHPAAREHSALRWCLRGRNRWIREAALPPHWPMSPAGAMIDPARGAAFRSVRRFGGGDGWRSTLSPHARPNDVGGA
jgi:hypothetical protein